MQKSSAAKLLLTGILTLCLALTSAVFGQGITSSALGGFVTTKQGQPVADATVTVVHVPTGTRSTTTTRTNGQYNLSGLRVGGPYSVTVTGKDYTPETTNDLYLDLGSAGTANFTLSTEVIQLEAMSVTGSRDSIFGSGKIGTGSSFTDRDIENVSTVRRNIQDVAVLDSRMALMSLDQGGQLSAQGQNFRFNSFTIDGVRADDPFGLNSNGFSSLRSPIPLEAIQTLNVELSPYSVRYAGATGAFLNAVIKSGTNDFHGAVSYEKTNENLRAKNPLTGVRDAFKERTFNYSLGGPIIRDRLFFFLDFDDFKRTTVAPQANFIPDAASIAAITARATTLGYNAGGLTAGENVAKQKTTIAKVDWNVSDQHRASFTYRKNEGQDVVFGQYTGSTTTSLSNFWYAQPRVTKSYTGQFNSQWTPDFRTEATYSYTTYDGSPANAGSPFPQVQIGGLTGTRLDTGATITNGVLFIGTESSRQLNVIKTVERQAKFSAEYSIGDHTISVGTEDIATKYSNAFVQYTNGYYIFPTIAAWQAGTPVTGYTLQKASTGFTIADAVARWSYDAYAFYIEDSWKPNQQLTLLAGLRYDIPVIPEAPPVAAGFSTAGFYSEGGRSVTANNTTNNGNSTFAPRVGFTYQFKTERKTQIRGGIGLFQGKNPAVWVSNAYSNAGATGAVGVSNSAGIPGFTFVADPAAQVPPAGNIPAPNINITDSNFKQPSSWKSNIAIDHQLPFGGITATIDYYSILVNQAINTEFLNYAIATSGPTTLPDGRIRYNGNPTSGTTANTQGKRRVAAFSDVFYLTNTGKGNGSGLTLQFARPMKNHWSWSASYTRANASEVSPITSSTASSNYTNRASFNPNEDVASTSNTAIKDRVVGSIAREFEFIKKFKTTVAAVYQGRTGHYYSWVFRGDANGDGWTFNDLLYVPTGPTDPKVTWAVPAERDAFFDYVNSTSLKKYAGSHAPRNSETSPWQQTIDLKVVQQIPIWGNLRGELFVNILNFWNLIDDNWGLQREVPFSYRRAVAGATYNAAGNGGLGSWAYTFNPGNNAAITGAQTLDTVPVTVNDTPISRWQAQVGIRLRF
jgi:outer membrane receptor for ferrienterochelin and colicin